MFSSNTSQVANGSILGVEDVFSAYLHRGNGNSLGNDIPNGIQFGGTPTNGTILHLTGDSLSDSAPVPCPFTSTGVGTSTSTKKYGTASLSYNGTSTNILTAASAALRFGTTADFTVECWVYNSSAGNQGVFHLGNDFGSGCVFVNMYPANQFQWGYDGSYTGGVGSFPSNTWIHVALVRQSGVLKLYVNGTKTGSDNTYAGNISLGRIWVGNYYDTNYAWNGFIDDFRVSNKAVYTADFTPPSAALAVDTIVAGSNYGGMVWAKNRTSIANHAIFDTLRGGSNTIRSNTTDANLSAGSIAFNTSGWCVNTTNAQFNGVNDNYVSWSFRRQAKFFDVVTWTGDGATSRLLNHNLQSYPGCIIVKRTDVPSDWQVFHRVNSSTPYTYDILKLNTQNSASYTAVANVATDTQFQVGTGYQYGFNNNANGGTYVAYLFAHNAGGFGTAGTDNVISCGSYNGNGTTTGPVITLNYEPQWVLIKRNDPNGYTGPWLMYDTMRGMPDGSNAAYLYANTSDAEGNSAWGRVRPLATGFQPMTDDPWLNASGSGYIYIAIRRGPMKTPTSGTSVFLPTTYTGNGSTQTITTTIRPDFVLLNWITVGYSETFDRLRGNELLYTQANASLDTSNQYISFANNTGFILPSSVSFTNASSNSYTPEAFTRAPSVIDVVCYTGTGSVLNVSHNLTVAPEMMWVKRRDTLGEWAVYHKDVGNTKWIKMNATSVPATSSNYWNNTTPTASVFTVGATPDVNTSAGTYVAYLFATCPGVSKVGSYTGNGTNQTINCGFSSGARLIMIKRTDAVGSWYLWDSSRGIVSGNDPYIRLNDGSVVTTTDAVDADNSGFIVNQESLNLNVNAATYIFWAVA